MQLTPNPMNVPNPRVMILCSHGNVPGGCSMCSPAGGGGGGGGVSGISGRSSGMMSWNEALSLWQALQREMTNQKDYLKGVNLQTLRRDMQALQSGPPLNAAQSFLTRFSQLPGMASLSAGLISLGGTAGNMVMRLSTGLQALQNRFTASLQQLGQTGLAPMLQMASQRVGAMLGEALNQLQETVQKSWRTLRRLLSMPIHPEAFQEAMQEFLENAYQESKKLLQTLVSLLMPFQQEKDSPEQEDEDASDEDDENPSEPMQAKDNTTALNVFRQP